MCPQKHIVDQWDVAARKFGFQPILGYENSETWYRLLGNAITNFNIGALNVYVYNNKCVFFYGKDTRFNQNP